MFKALKEFKNRFFIYRSRNSVHNELDVILSQAHEKVRLEDRLEWLVHLMQWIRYEGHVDALVEKEVGSLQVARLRFLVLVLDRHLEWKKDVALILRSVVHEVSGLELYTETGLPGEVGLWSELSDRLMLKILPSPPLDHQLSYLFWELFPSANDPLWISSIDRKTFEWIVDLFNYEVQESEGNWNRFRDDLTDALIYLVIQIRAIGLSPAIRNRLNKADFTQSAFYALSEGLNDFLASYKKGDTEKTIEYASKFRMIIWECRRELVQVHKDLEDSGVSVNLVFQMARLRTFLQRVDSLLEILLNEKLDYKKVTSFLSKLVEENQELRSISTLFAQNVSMLARKVVERAAETGEHYITRTKDEYRAMVKAAAGGGAVTTLTVFLKMGILSLGMTGFVEGTAASLNYALSFVAIHLLGFTLGTKQPAMTAPALAEKIKDVGTAKGMESLVDNITHIIRSQVAAVGGNVLLVVPCAILIDLIYFAFTGNHVVSPGSAQYAYKSVDIFGPAIIFAAFTGTLLWTSSLIAGWSDNWFALHSLRTTLARSPSLKAVFGVVGARNIAVYLEKNMSGLVGNISLGILLGMIPELLKFFNIPLDVRHVTLSSGTLAASIPALGLDFLQSKEFVRSVIGIFFIGVFNVLVSFGLALWVAMRARGIKTQQQRAIQEAVWARFRSKPLSFFWPSSKTVAVPPPPDSSSASSPAATPTQKPE